MSWQRTLWLLAIAASMAHARVPSPQVRRGDVDIYISVGVDGPVIDIGNTATAATSSLQAAVSGKSSATSTSQPSSLTSSGLQTSAQVSSSSTSSARSTASSFGSSPSSSLGASASTSSTPSTATATSSASSTQISSTSSSASSTASSGQLGSSSPTSSTFRTSTVPQASSTSSTSSSSSATSSSSSSSTSSTSTPQTTPSTTSTPTTTTATTTNTNLLTISITNAYASVSALSITFTGPSPVAGSAPNLNLTLNAGAAWVFEAVDGTWSGNAAVGLPGVPEPAAQNSLIEASIEPAVLPPVWFDVSFVNAFSVPISCSSPSDGQVDGCLDPTDWLANCPSSQEVYVGDQLASCLNPDGPYTGPSAPFSDGSCEATAYTWTTDNQAVIGTYDTLVECCVGTSCPTPNINGGSKR